MAKSFILYREDDTEVKLPTRWCICGTCRGNGKESAYLGAITSMDREPGGAWEDPDDFEDYMRGGYDRTCQECQGSGKVLEVDTDLLSPSDLKEWERQCQDDRDYERLCAAERRMGA